MINVYKIKNDFEKNEDIRKISFEFIKEIYVNFDKINFEHFDAIFKLWMEEFISLYGDIENKSANNKVCKEKLCSYYNIDSSAELNLYQLLFSIQTVYTIFIKYVGFHATNYNPCFFNYYDKSFVGDIINGNYFVEHGINNYCNNDIYAWVNNVKLFDDYLSKLCAMMEVYHLSEKSLSLTMNCDSLKQIYELFICKEFRHSLGEYYTPDWLTQHTISNIIHDDKSFSVLDPTCGSGTFLYESVKLLLDNGNSIDFIIKNIAGFDINPIAVLTSKTNFLLATYKDTMKNFTIPVYIFDTLTDVKDNKISIDCGNKTYIFDINSTDDGIINEYSLIKNYIWKKYSDAVAVHNLQKFDYIVGNPPWINWEYLSETNKKKSEHLWYEYGLFNASGRNLSFSKEDISTLITYVVIDKYLKDNGKLAFVIRQGILKSAQNGVNFRKFYMPNSDTSIKVIKVDDLSQIKPFDNATNSTAILYLLKGLPTQYPVEYNLWQKKSGHRISSNMSLADIYDSIDITNMVAIPSKIDDDTSVWASLPIKELEISKKVLGENNYKARTGVFTGGANAVYWVNVLENHNDTVLIENVTERAKRSAPKIQFEIENKYVFPLCRGTDIEEWKATPSLNIICPHTAETKMKPVSLSELSVDTPKTLEYFNYFKEYIDARKGFASWERNNLESGFYAIQRIGEYSFSKYKVAWRYIASSFICAVIDNSDKKNILPNEKIMYISTDNEKEAFYLCGILSSDIIKKCIESYMNPTSISTHVLEKLNIPQFDPTNATHLQIADNCKKGHMDYLNKPTYKKNVDDLVSSLYLK